MDTMLLSIAIGLIVSLLVTELFGLSVGGMIVPGYLAMSFGQPMAIVFTVLAAMVTWMIVREIARHTILFGRRRVVLMMLVGFAVGTAFRLSLGALMGSTLEASTSGEGIDPMIMIGFIIPGLIALWFERQGFIQTLSPMMSSAALVYLTLIMIGWEPIQ